MKKLIVFMMSLLLLVGRASAAQVAEADDYAEAWSAVWAGEYRLASVMFADLGDYEDSAELAYLLGVSEHAQHMTDLGDGYTIAYEFHGRWGLINLEEHTLTEPFWDSVSPP